MYLLGFVGFVVVFINILYKNCGYESGMVLLVSKIITLCPQCWPPMLGGMSLPDLAIVPCVSCMSRIPKPSVLGAKQVV